VGSTGRFACIIISSLTKFAKVAEPTHAPHPEERPAGRLEGRTYQLQLNRHLFTLPHLSCCARLSSPRGGEANGKRYGLRLALTGVRRTGETRGSPRNGGTRSVKERGRPVRAGLREQANAGISFRKKNINPHPINHLSFFLKNLVPHPPNLPHTSPRLVQRENFSRRFEVGQGRRLRLAGNVTAGPGRLYSRVPPCHYGHVCRTGTARLLGFGVFSLR
jgi:hypothetical protein